MHIENVRASAWQVVRYTATRATVVLFVGTMSECRDFVRANAPA
ncbi:hypothetical protein CATRI_12195 [Corynebacterium atrinae]|nr:hypothetical protein [Corynebacterium atrinae]WJY64488.1 hypothetical protein CATRI_12195 [Corynebacterium atrinae]